MARLFISYKREEQNYALALRQWLIDHQNWADHEIFVDLAKIRSGDDWADMIFSEAEASEVMLFIASEASLHVDSFCYRELKSARGITLAVTINDLSPDDERLHRALPFGSTARQIAALDQAPVERFEFFSPVDKTLDSVELNRSQVENIGSTLRDLGIAPDSFTWTPNKDGPFPGLRALQEGDEALFFGRSLEIRDALRQIEKLNQSISQKALLIQAPSGAGKSSFLRAGLWHRLRRHAAFTPLGIIRTVKGALFNEEWGLVAELSRSTTNCLDLSRNQLKEKAIDDLPGLLLEIADADQSNDAGRRTLLLGIDQAEEISSLSDTEQEELRSLFDAIEKAKACAEQQARDDAGHGRSKKLDVRLLLTARDDDIDNLLEYLDNTGIPHSAVDDYRLHRLPTSRYIDIITGPAKVADDAGFPIKLEKPLAEALSSATAESMSQVGDALPVLALTLRRLIINRRNIKGELDLAPADAQTFLKEAVADTVWEAKSYAKAEDEELRRLVIPALINWDPRAGDGGIAKRRIASDEELFTGARAELKPLADALVDQRLMTRSAGKNGPVYEIAHEALLRVPPLGDLILQLKDKFLRTEMLLMEVQEWLDKDRHSEHLARRGERLREAQNLLVDSDFGEHLSKNALGLTEYLEACSAAEEAEEAEKNASRQRELDTAKKAAHNAKLAEEKAQEASDAAKIIAGKTRFALGLSIFFLIIVTIVGVFAVQKMLEAERQKEVAKQQTIKANEQAAEAERLQEVAEQQTIKANEQAAEAQRQKTAARMERDQTLRTESRYLANAAEELLQKSAVSDAIALARLALPKDLDTFSDRPLTQEPLQVLYDAYHKLLENRVFRGHEDIVSGALELKDGRILTWSKDGTARIWHIDGTRGPVLHGNGEKINGALQLSRGELVIWSGNIAQIWELDGTPGAKLEKHDSTINGVLELPDGRLLTWSNDTSARVWKVGGEQEFVFDDHEGPITGALLFENNRIITWSNDYTARLWAPGGIDKPTIFEHPARVSEVLKMGNDKLLTINIFEQVKLWNLDGTPVIQADASEQIDAIGAIAIRDGSFLTWQWQEKAQIWNSDGSQGLSLKPSGTIKDAIFSKQGLIITLNYGNTVQLWDEGNTSGITLRGHEQTVNGVKTLNNGSILTWSEDKTARVWLPNGSIERIFRGHEGPILGAHELSNGQLLTWSKDNTARLWYSETPPNLSFKGHSIGSFMGGGITGAVETPNRQILTWGSDKTAKFWTSEGVPGTTLQSDDRSFSHVLVLPNEKVFTLTNNAKAQLWDNNGKVSAILSNNSKVSRYENGGNLNSPTLIFRNRLNSKGALLLKNNRILIWDGSSTAKIWNNEGTTSLSLKGHKLSINGALELTDSRIITWSKDKTARIWDPNGNPGPVLEEHNGNVLGAITLQNNQILTWSNDTYARLWFSDGKPGPILEGHNEAIYGAIETNNGRILTWSADNTARMWNLDGTPGPILENHLAQVSGAMALTEGRVLTWSNRYAAAHIWNADGDQLTTLSSDNLPNQTGSFWSNFGIILLKDKRILIWNNNEAQIWDEEGKMDATLQGHTLSLNGALQLTDGRILTYSRDGTAKFWPGSLNSMVTWADSQIDKLNPLTLAEQCKYFLETKKVCDLVGDDFINIEPIQALISHGEKLLNAGYPGAEKAFELAISIASENKQKPEVEKQIADLYTKYSDTE